MTQDIPREKVERESGRFLEGLTDYGSSDIATAVETFLKVGLNGSELADQIREFSEDTGSPLDKIDICYVACDYILQMARNKISEVIDFDIVNDIKGGTEFYTSGNYMCTSFDYSSEAKEQLIEKLKESTQDQLEELKEDVFVMYLLESTEIDMPKKEVKV